MNTSENRADDNATPQTETGVIYSNEPQVRDLREDPIVYLGLMDGNGCKHLPESTAAEAEYVNAQSFTQTYNKPMCNG